MKLTKKTKLAIIALDKAKVPSRIIATVFNLGKSTVRDFLRRETYQSWWLEYDKLEALEKKVKSPSKRIKKGREAIEEVPSNIFKIATTKEVKSGCTHFVITDTHSKPGSDLTYCNYIGEYLAHILPQVIVHLGDHADMVSLSPYDRGTKRAEGKRINEDFEASIEGMRRILEPIYKLQQKQLKTTGAISYKPKMVLTLGNHEERILRHVNANPELSGFVSYDNLKYKEFGWEVVDYLVPYNIHGVNYVHFMANPMSGKPYGGQVAGILRNVGETFVTGHKQGLEVATRTLPASGKQQWGIIAGSCYLHDERYKGPQGNKHWRGLLVLHNVEDGNFNLTTTSLEYLEGEYGKV